MDDSIERVEGSVEEVVPFVEIVVGVVVERLVGSVEGVVCLVERVDVFVITVLPKATRSEAFK